MFPEFAVIFEVEIIDNVSHMKILVIEDEPDLRDVIVKSLQKEMFLVETAHDLSSASDKISTYDYDCILLDHV